MRYGMSAELEEFRDEVREFVRRHAPRVPVKAGVRSAEDAEELALLKQWTARLFEAGYIGGDWPPEYGGAGEGHQPERDVVVGEELAAARAPAAVQGAADLVAHALIDFGTEDQRRRFLPRIRAGEIVFCQLFSEPGSGSDLASLRTRAVATPDGGYEVTGQKVWTTNGHWADYGYLLARTDPDAPKHRGISAFIVDMSLPGVDVRPLREMTGTSDFNEIFLDGVRLEADALIGEAGQGWRIANSSLGHERSSVATAAVRLRQNVRALRSFAETTVRGGRPLIEDGAVAERIGALAAAVDALSAVVYANISRWSRGAERPHDAAMAKLMFSELGVRIAKLGLDLAGEDGALVEGDPGAVDSGRWQDEFLYARGFTIAGGTSEIMRSMIAERGLGLPR